MGCKYVKSKSKKLCIGDLSKKIQVLSRAITAKTTDQNYNHNFTIVFEPFASVSTMRGKDVFDGSNLVGTATHVIRFRKNSNIVTSQNFIRFKDQYYDILSVQNFNEDDEFYEILATNRGTISSRVNFK